MVCRRFPGRGGGYTWVVVDREGYEIAGYLASLGFTCFVLFYRLPADGWAAGPNVALSDAQRAMRLIRHRAMAYGIDPARVAHMGSRKNLLGDAPTPEMESMLTPAKTVAKEAPPCFLVHAENDAVVVPENSLEYRAALKKLGVPVEAHLFNEGGHGFALRRAIGLPCAAWPDLFLGFARRHGLMIDG